MADAAEQRKAQYKSTGLLDRRSMLFERCQARLRYARSAALDAARVRHKPLAADLRQLIDEESNQMEIDFCIDDIGVELSDDDYVEVMLKLQEQLNQDAAEAEQLMLDRESEADAARMKDLVDAFAELQAAPAPSGDSTELLCPVCQKSCVKVLHESIICKCGLRVRRLGEGISTETLQAALVNALELHRSKCTARSQFEQSDLGGLLPAATLLLTCDTCNLFHVVI